MQEIPKTYTASDWEDKLYKLWEESGYFNPDNIESDEKYCNVLPPPNANGELHLGHASGYTVMDIFGRFQRMQGKKVLLLPGKDHAGIQTQVVFERKLQEEQGITRHDLGREKFYQATYDFCVDRSKYMRSQEKRIGISADWSREKFTLDPKVSKRAMETFVQMYQDGMIYRGERIINWCSRCATALSDIEVIHKETEGKIFFIQYPVKDSQEAIIVATTRPETMLGDTAVAVHPDDSRYKNLIGKTLILPLIGREIPVIADKRIDQTFGTGAVKITPAHDPLDWEIGKDHKLQTIQVIDEEAKITKLGGNYFGLSVKDARNKILVDLSNLGLFVKEIPHVINLSQCERCKTTIEPLISKQWFVNVDAEKYSIKKESIKALESGSITFHPDSMREQMIRWLENLHDWCISRQLWWGHRIPVWYRGEEIYCGIETPEGENWKQESDTLDTWFSSSQWPYTTLGYPEEKDAKTFYPTDMMVMGRDLLFFWATRMVMFGLYKTGSVPFKQLYFTGLVRDKDGQKMSKSKGNGIDALQMIDKFGSDAVRLSLAIGTTPGLDFRLYEEKIDNFRNFTNKLWNIGRYVLQNSNETQIGPIENYSEADDWILHNLHKTTQEVSRLLDKYDFSLAGTILQLFTWDEFADWYVEIHKIEKNDTVLRYVFEQILKLWHPFMPFVTEALWQNFQPNEKLLMIQRYPESGKVQNYSWSSADKFSNTITIIKSIRNIRSTYHIDPVRKIDITIITQDTDFIKSQKAIIQRLARVENINIASKDTAPHQAAYALIENIKLYAHLEGVLDIDKEKARLQKELEQTKRYKSGIAAKLDNPKFVSQAPEAIIQRSREDLQKAELKIEEIAKQIENLL